jgi:hypothetical protein
MVAIFHRPINQHRLVISVAVAGNAQQRSALALRRILIRRYDSGLEFDGNTLDAMA